MVKYLCDLNWIRMMICAIVLITLNINLAESLTDSLPGSIPNLQPRNAGRRSFLSTYDKSKPPSKGRQPITVWINMIINDLNLNQNDGVMEVTMSFRTMWKDDRLKVMAENAADGVKYVDDTVQEYLWKPFIMFENQHETTLHNPDDVEEKTMKVNSTGHVLYTTELSKSFTCKGLKPRMHEQSHDQQVTCSIKMETYSPYMDTVMLKPSIPFSVFFSDDIQLYDFSVKDVVSKNCTKTYLNGAKHQSCIEFDFTFGQGEKVDYVGKCLYVSSFILVIGAWSSLWLDGVQYITVRLTMSLAITVALIVQLGAAATWYEEEDMAGNKNQVWLAFCAVLTSFVFFETTLLHMQCGDCVRKCRGEKKEEKTPILEEGQVEMPATESKCKRITDIIAAIIYMAVFIIFIFTIFTADFDNNDDDDNIISNVSFPNGFLS